MKYLAWIRAKVPIPIVSFVHGSVSWYRDMLAFGLHGNLISSSASVSVTIHGNKCDVYWSWKEKGLEGGLPGEAEGGAGTTKQLVIFPFCCFSR